jgi:hypothetical protein
LDFPEATGRGGLDEDASAEWAEAEDFGGGGDAFRDALLHSAAFPEASGEAGWAFVAEGGGGAGGATGDGFGDFPEATRPPAGGFGDHGAGDAAFPDATPEASGFGDAFPPAIVDDQFGAGFSAFGDSDPFAAAASGSGDNGFGF